MAGKETQSDKEFLDRIIATVRSRGNGKSRKLTVPDLDRLTEMAINSIEKQETLLDIRPPIIVFGDIHGDIDALLCLLNIIGWPPENRLLFLGDYVDRGKFGVEVASLLLALEVRYPTDVFLLRGGITNPFLRFQKDIKVRLPGNHEDAAQNVETTCFGEYSFKQECLDRYNLNVWWMFLNVFACLPLAALVGDHVFCMHGGIPKHLDSFNTIRRIRRPIKCVPEKGIVCDLLWADPSKEVDNWANNKDRGVSVIFGEKALDEFCKRMNIDLVIRAHEAVDEGTAVFGSKKRLITVFSAPGYIDGTSSAGIVYIDGALQVHRKEFEPRTVYGELQSTLKSFHDYLRGHRLVVKDWSRLDADLALCVRTRPCSWKRKIEYYKDDGGDLCLSIEVSVESPKRIMITPLYPEEKPTIKWRNVEARNEGELLWSLLSRSEQSGTAAGPISAGETC